MDYSSLKTLLNWIGGSAALFFALGLMYVIYKTESLHMLRLRLWHWLFGRVPVIDSEVKSLIGQQSDLMAFRLFSGLRVNTLDEIHQLKIWSQSKGISLSQLSEITPFFDASHRRIKNPLFPKLLHLVVVWLALVLAAASLFIGMERRVSIVINDTGNWYWVDMQGAQQTFFNLPLAPSRGKPLTPQQCNVEKAEQEIKADHDQVVLCSIWQNKTTPTPLQSMFTEQRAMALYFLIIFFGMMMWHARRVYQLGVIKKLQSQIRKIDSSE